MYHWLEAITFNIILYPVHYINSQITEGYTINARDQ